MRFVFLLVIVVIFPVSARTQVQCSCSDINKQAESEFNDGKYLICISTLESALKECYCSRLEKDNILELLVRVYLELDQIEKAESVVRRLLNNDPYYTVKDKTHLEDLNYIVEKARKKKHPLLSLGGRVALGYPFYKITETASDSSLPGVDYGAPYNTENIYLKPSLLIKYEFSRYFSINAEFGGSSFSYYRNFQKQYENGNSILLKYSEKTGFIEVPVYLNGNIPLTNKVLIYGSLGLGWLRIVSAKGDATVSVTGNGNNFNASDYDINVMNMRNLNNYEWVCILGVGYRIKEWKMNLGVRYCVGLTSFTSGTDHFKNEILNNKYYYFDNPVKINMLEIGISVAYSIIYNKIKM
jgi:hypothetical protein